jgi:rare lipoprotein A
MKKIILLLAFIFLTSFNNDISKASYYGKKFHGRKTASGEIFDMNKLTAAHKKLKFGTIVKVTSIATNKSVFVRINDRGPFIKGRDIDLSKSAFFKIAPKRYGGSIKVKLEIIK